MGKLNEAFQKARTPASLEDAAFLRIAEHLDAWENQVTGFGTSRDKTTYGRFRASRLLSDQALSDLYHYSDLAARMVDVVPDEMFREGFVVQFDDESKTTECAEKFEQIMVREAFADGCRWGRAFGGGAVLIGADDKRPSDVPLIPERAADISWLYAFDRRYIHPMSYYRDPTHPKFGRPETYMVTSPTGRVTSSKVVHETRLILFGGANTGEQEREENQGWDFSLLQRAHDAMRMFDTGWTAVENLLTDANQGVWTMSGLGDAIASGQTSYIQDRVRTADLRRSVVRSIIVDAGDGQSSPKEEFTRQSVSFEGIPNTLDKFMLRLAASVKLPVTILMGQSPAGMNATGESDFRWFYDQIRAEQTQKIGHLVRRLADIWCRTKAGGGKSLPLRVTWPQLWTETPRAEAERKKLITESDQILIMNGVFTADEVALIRGQPGGYDVDIVLDDAGKKAREESLKIELEAMASGTAAPGLENDGSETQATPENPEPSGPPEGFGEGPESP